MNLRRLALVGNRRCMVVFSVFSSIVLIIACDRTGKKDSAESRSDRIRTDTLLVRDTIVVVDTVLVERETVRTRTLVDTILIEKEVEKRVEVPAEIPEHYERAWKILSAELSAEFADEIGCFAGVGSLSVAVTLNEHAKDILSEQRARDKFELTLRRHGVPLTAGSNPYLSLYVEALWDRDKNLAAVAFGTALMEPIVYYRGDTPRRRFVALWEDRSFGYLGRKVGRASMLDYIEEKAERVANLYLSAN